MEYQNQCLHFICIQRLKKNIYLYSFRYTSPTCNEVCLMMCRQLAGSCASEMSVLFLALNFRHWNERTVLNGGGKEGQFPCWTISSAWRGRLEAVNHCSAKVQRQEEDRHPCKEISPGTSCLHNEPYVIRGSRFLTLELLQIFFLYFFYIMGQS